MLLSFISYWFVFISSNDSFDEWWLQCTIDLVSPSISKNKRKLKKGTSYQCNHFAEAFSFKRDLMKHFKIHSTKEWYQSNQCKKVFSQNSILNSYMKIHIEEKSYQCNHCGKPLHLKLVIKNICKYTLGRNYISVSTAIKFSQE